MDAQQQLVWDAEISCAVLGNAAGEFVLLSLDDKGLTLNKAEIERAHQKSFQYCGVMAYADGQCGARSESDPVSLSVMMQASFEFARLVVAKLKPLSDGADWLQKLWNLPDERGQA